MSGRSLFVGLMSGTSLDAVDAVLVEFADDASDALRVLGDFTAPIPEALYGELLALQRPGEGEIARAAEAANALADLYATATLGALAAAGVAAADVRAVGCHGQTVRHRPERGWTVQINNPARLAERTGIDVVADFRSRDVAAGGQGAPLVPAFHAAVFGRPDRHRVIVNIGGIANVTDLPPGGPVRGWDTGPGNVLMDLWIRRQTGAPFDAQGVYAAGGRCDSALLHRWLDEPYFALPPPKSTGRDLFNAGWLDSAWRDAVPSMPPRDVQATLLALTVTSVAEAIERHCPGAAEVLVCGGGARNDALMGGLAQRLPARQVGVTDAAGLPSGHVEPVAFAWLARRSLLRRPGNLPAVTGARGPRVLGALWPA